MKNKVIEDRSAFLDITNHPDVIKFIEECKFLKEPSPNEIEDIKKEFSMGLQYGDYPNNIIGLDANFYEANIRKEIPFTNVGFVKVSNILLKKKEIEGIKDNKFLNPFEIAKIQKNNESHVFVLPSSNILYNCKESVRDGFRQKMDETFKSIKNFEEDENSNLLQTLFWLFENRKGFKGSKEIYIKKCPNHNCSGKDIMVENIKEDQFCPYCNEQIYATDCLRIWEEILEDSSSNISALSRFSNVIKTIFLAHYIRTLKMKTRENYLQLLSGTMFVLNSPLAVFGNPAWVHGSLMKIIFEVNEELRSNGYDEMMILGIPQSSDVLSFANYISKYIDNGSILCVNDNFRKKYINFSRQESSTTFGAETYYGQDFIYKTSKGKMKVFSVPYPFKSKENIEEFKVQKSKLENYKSIGRYLKFIEEFDCDMFDNAVIPSLLAKKYSVINLQPGSKVLDLLSKSKLES